MENFWFNRMAEYWSLPRPQEREAVIEHVRRADLQVVQTGNFGPFFYGLADDPEVPRFSVGMPLLGIRKNLAYAAELIPQIQEAGARVIGQMSTTWHYANHKKGLGLFGAWERIWTDDLLGQAPCADAAEAHQLEKDGSIRCRSMEGRPYLTYIGCMCNPNWLATLKSMARKAIDLGLDGFNVHHNYESFCHCAYCRDYVRSHLQEQFFGEDLQKLFGAGELADVEDLLSPQPDCPADLKQRLELAISKAANLRRKEAFDEVFIDYGRSLKPDLMLAQWYHKYNFRPHDERSLLPGALWARDENYIWYSQGPYKWMSLIKRGYLADMGLPARFVHAAGGGKPFIIMKYDYRRWRLWIAEATAHHGASLAFHAGPPRLENEADTNVAPEDYYNPVIRYQRFLSKHDALLHPARAWSQIALVYPRRSELEADMACLDALKRLGQLMEDRHLLFDIILDEQLLRRASDYAALILPDLLRLSREEGEHLHRYVENGGKLVLTGDTGKYRLDGEPHAENPLADWQRGGTGIVRVTSNVLYIPQGPWEPDLLEVEKGVQQPVYPFLEQDPFGQEFLKHLEDLLDPINLETDAPWSVRVRAWLPEQSETLVLHWVNYHQDEDACIEIPIPTGPLQAECEVPNGYTVERVEWLYPEMKTPALLDHEPVGSRIRFTIPTLIVYGLSVLHLKKT